MKLHAQVGESLNIFTGYGADYLEVNRVRHQGPLLLGGDLPARAWGVGAFESLRPEDFAVLLELDPELVLIGTGARQRFPAASLLRPLVERGVGFEVMDTLAACRTFNILVGEGRRAVAALLAPQAGAAAEAAR